VTLLQAAIMGGMVLMIVLLMMLVVGIPILTILIKAISRRRVSKEAEIRTEFQQIEKADPDNKSLNTARSALLAFCIIIFLFILMAATFDKCNSGYGYSN
jgi:ABC-type Fe3+ transport system permease subunit